MAARPDYRRLRQQQQWQGSKEELIHDFDRISGKPIQCRKLFLYAQFPTSKCNLIFEFEIAINGNGKEAAQLMGRRKAQEALPVTEASLPGDTCTRRGGQISRFVLKTNNNKSEEITAVGTSNPTKH
jgi:hypothetical protein